MPGLIRNAALGVVLIGSIAFRWPLVGVVAEFLALRPQAVELGLPLRQRVLGGDQRFGIPGIAHDRQQPVDGCL